MRKPKIFIGSSTEQLDLAKAIELWLDDEDCEPVLWTSSFEPGDYTLERLLQNSKSCDGAVMIFGKDDKTWFRETELESPRDNVVYELGLFAGAAKNNAAKRVIFCRVGASKVASDLTGISYVYVDPDKPTRPKTHEEIRKYARRMKRFELDAESDLFQMTTKRELFKAGSALISTKQTTVTLAAKTPVPIMGPRPYNNAASPFDYETEQHDLYWAIAEKAAAGRSKFTLIASAPSIVEDMKKCKDSEFHARIKENLTRMYELASRAGSQLRLYWHEGLSPPAFLVADAATLMWWKGGNDDSIWIMHESPMLASALSTSTTLSYNKLTLDSVTKKIESAVLA